jgi:hypothetical protein
MFQQYILPIEEISHGLEPYIKALENYGIDETALIGIAVGTLGRADYLHPSGRNLILLHMRSVGGDLQLEDRADFERAVHTCMDAVGVVLSELTPTLERVFGRIPPYVALQGFAGHDPVISTVAD